MLSPSWPQEHRQAPEKPQRVVFFAWRGMMPSAQSGSRVAGFPETRGNLLGVMLLGYVCMASGHRATHFDCQSQAAMQNSPSTPSRNHPLRGQLARPKSSRPCPDLSSNQSSGTLASARKDKSLSHKGTRDMQNPTNLHSDTCCTLLYASGSDPHCVTWYLSPLRSAPLLPKAASSRCNS